MVRLSKMCTGSIGQTSQLPSVFSLATFGLLDLHFFTMVPDFPFRSLYWKVLHNLYCLHAEDRVVARILVGVVDDLGDPIDRVLILIHDLVGVVCPLTVYLNVSSGMFSMVIYWL